jgi:transposase
MLRAMSRKAIGIELTGEERFLLEHMVKSPTSTQREVLRAQIILKAADGEENLAIGEELGLSNHSVGMWRNRFGAGRMAALANRPKKRTPIKYTAEDRRRVVEMACTGSPEAETHWSVRTLAKATGVGRETVRAVLGEAHLRPHRMGTFTQSNDPEFREKLIDVVGLYTNPPDNAVVLCVDEKTQLQALDRTQPQLPMRPDQIARRTHDYKRNGTTQLFAALDVAAARVQAKCQDRHRSEDFLRFMDGVVKHHGVKEEIHVVLDNVSSHKSKAVQSWKQAHPQVSFHFVPTYSSWLNLVEIFFGLVQRKVVSRGIFSSKLDLVAKLLAFVDKFNREGKRFQWTKTPDEILMSLERLSGH